MNNNTLQKPELLSEFIQVRVTPSEKILIEKIAQEKEMDSSKVCRFFVRNGLKTYQQPSATA